MTKPTITFIKDMDRTFGPTGEAYVARQLKVEMLNTKGEAEVYLLMLDGVYTSGNARLTASVQRTNGSFAHLPEHKARDRYNRLASVAAEQIEAYEQELAA